MLNANPKSTVKRSLFYYLYLSVRVNCSFELSLDEGITHKLFNLLSGQQQYKTGDQYFQKQLQLNFLIR